MRAPLRGAARVGLVLDVRDGAVEGLKPLAALVDGSPVVTREQLDLLLWIAAQSLSSPGSSAAALLPPPLGAISARVQSRVANANAPVIDAAYSRVESADAPSMKIGGDETSPPIPPHANTGLRPELHLGAGRERRILELAGEGTLLLIVPDVDAAARWAQRLATLGRVARLDSGVGDAERARGWIDLGRDRVRLAVGTRSAWLAPMPRGATLALVDEQEAAHKPPGHPRIHARDVALERARREVLRLVLTSGAPSVEMWWRATSGHATLHPGERATWPVVTVADTRGILRREPLTPELARTLRETLAAGGRAFLAVSRLASALACDECGLILRCGTCALALAYARAAARLSCRLCGRTAELPETCPQCHGRRLTPFGWGAERVEHAVRRRFPHARVARYEPEAGGKRKPAQRAAAADAEIVIGTRGALRLFGPGALSLAGFVSPDQLLRLPDFRAGERMLAFLWAAAERVRAGGRLVIQSQNPAHHAFAAVAAHELERFYGPELHFRSELGYPPFRRLAILTVRAGRGNGAPTVEDVEKALAGSSRLTVYPPSPARGERGHRIVAKGHEDLPEALGSALTALTRGNAAGRGIIDVEVDPVEWPS